MVNLQERTFAFSYRDPSLLGTAALDYQDSSQVKGDQLQSPLGCLRGPMGPLAPAQCVVPFPGETLMVLSSLLGLPGNRGTLECVRSLSEHPALRSGLGDQISYDLEYSGPQTSYVTWLRHLGLGWRVLQVTFWASSFSSQESSPTFFSCKIL